MRRMYAKKRDFHLIFFHGGARLLPQGESRHEGIAAVVDPARTGGPGSLGVAGAVCDGLWLAVMKSIVITDADGRAMPQNRFFTPAAFRMTAVIGSADACGIQRDSVYFICHCLRRQPPIIGVNTTTAILSIGDAKNLIGGWRYK